MRRQAKAKARLEKANEEESPGWVGSVTQEAEELYLIKDTFYLDLSKQASSRRSLRRDAPKATNQLSVHSPGALLLLSLPQTTKVRAWWYLPGKPPKTIPGDHRLRHIFIPTWYFF